MNSNFFYGSEHLSSGTCLDIAAGKTKGEISQEAQDAIHASWQAVQQIVKSQIPVYGVNTGFGPLCDTHISESDTSQLQVNILKSHSVGVGKPIPAEIAKIMMITKVPSTALSGILIMTSSPLFLKKVLWVLQEIWHLYHISSCL
jgi:histidine ammonia-lyase